MSQQERFAAHASEILLYTLLLVQPLVGWCPPRDIRLSFSGRCICSPLPHRAMLYAFLRRTHTFLAYFLFLAFLAHFGAILFHTLIVRDGLLNRMMPGRTRAPRA